MRGSEAAKNPFRYAEWGYEIQASVFEVFRTLGQGFLEKVYETALVAELDARGLHAKSQAPVRVQYKGRVVGEYFADILVEDVILIEIKAQRIVHAANAAQLLNYLAASHLSVGYLVNFHHPRASVRRFVR